MTEHIPHAAVVLVEGTHHAGAGCEAQGIDAHIIGGHQVNLLTSGDVDADFVRLHIATHGLDGGGGLHGNGAGIEGALSGGRGAVGGVVYLGSLGLAGDGHLLCLGVDTGFRGEGGNGHIAHTFVVERHGAVVVAGNLFHRAFHKVGAVAVLVVELGGRCGRLVEGFGRLVGEEVAGLAYLIAVVIVI